MTSISPNQVMPRWWCIKETVHKQILPLDRPHKSDVWVGVCVFVWLGWGLFGQMVKLITIVPAVCLKLFLRGYCLIVMGGMRQQCT